MSHISTKESIIEEIITEGVKTRGEIIHLPETLYDIGISVGREEEKRSMIEEFITVFWSRWSSLKEKVDQLHSIPDLSFKEFHDSMRFNINQLLSDSNQEEQ